MDHAVLHSEAMRTAFATPRVEWPPRGDHFADDDEPTAKQPEHLRLLALTLSDEVEAVAGEESIEPPPMSGIRRSASDLLDPPLRVAPPSPPSARSAQIDLPPVVRKDVEIVDAKVANAPPRSRSMFLGMGASAIIAAALTVIVFAFIVGLPRPSVVRIARSMHVLDAHHGVMTQSASTSVKKRAGAAVITRTWVRPKTPTLPKTRRTVSPRPGIVRTLPF